MTLLAPAIAPTGVCHACGTAAAGACSWRDCGLGVCAAHAAPGPAGAPLCLAHHQEWRRTHGRVGRALGAALLLGGAVILAAGVMFFRFAWWFLLPAGLFLLAGLAVLRGLAPSAAPALAATAAHRREPAAGQEPGSGRV